MQKALRFKIEKKLFSKNGNNTLGRAGVLNTPHGEIKTPAFVAVGTKATVKSLNVEQVKDTGTEVVLGNTYHLYLQPGDEIVRSAGGMGKFMNWQGPTMTDSGGFQVFSLGSAYGKEISKITKITDPSLLIPERFDDSLAPRLAKIGNDGVSFKSHLDGSIHYITPEKSIEIQHNLGADIIFAFDECTSPVEDFKYQEEALERTHAWAKRSLKRHLELEEEKEKNLFTKQNTSIFGSLSPRDRGALTLGPSACETPKNESILSKGYDLFPQALFGIVQGGREESLRKKSAKIISEMRVLRSFSEEGSAPSPSGRAEGGVGFDGFGIGGSFAKEDMSSAVRWVNEILPEDKPRHLLGIGEPEDLFMGIENGVDLFDCVLPTRLGRNGTLYTKSGKINILNTKYREDHTIIDTDCSCYSCKNYTKAYIGHLFRGKEMLAGTLSSIHNLYFIVNLVKKIRQSIINDTFYEYKNEFLQNYKSR